MDKMDAPFFNVSPSLSDLEGMAALAFVAMPQELRDHIDGVVIQVADWPSADVMEDLNLDSPFDLLGLYQGVPLDCKSVSHTPMDVDVIYLYRRPILDYWCETGEGLPSVIRHVLIHEIGHHFGLSDADMTRIENEG